MLTDDTIAMLLILVMVNIFAILTLYAERNVELMFPSTIETLQSEK